MNDIPNEALRGHVTRLGFDLSLGKTHIAALVWIDYQIRYDEGWSANSDEYNLGKRPRGLHARTFNLFAGGTTGLITRGLVTHTDPESIRRPKGTSVVDIPFRRIWRITRAGKLVVSLLREAGIYQEFEAALPMPRGVERAS